MRKIICFFKNLFHRITVITLLFVICCIVIPTIIFTESVYGYSIGRFEKTLIKNIQTETDSYADLLEQELQAINLQIYGLLSDSMENTVRVKLEMGNKDTYFALQMKQLQAYMESIKYCHHLLDSIELFYPELLRKVTITALESYTEITDPVEEIVKNSNSRHQWNDSERIIYWDGEGSGFEMQYEELNVVVMATISRQNMKNYLSTYSQQKGAVFALDANIGMGNEFFVSTDSRLDKTALPENLQSGEYSVLKMEGKEYLLTCSAVGDDMRLYQLLSFDNVSTILDEHKAMMNLFAVILIFFAALFIVLFYVIIHKPIEHARQTFIQMEKGELGVQMGKSRYVEFQGMYNQFDSMSKRIQHLIEQEYELRLLNTKAQMKSLQYQISPHFLYNTYFTLCGLLQQEDYDGAEQMSGIIGKYLKYITVSTDETATLEAELEHALAYAQIQQIRFSRRISVQFADCPPELSRISVPRLIVQPLIENAFEHGVRDMLEGGVIQVAVSGSTEELCICVEDNGTNMPEEKVRELQELLQHKETMSGDSVALINIHRRLKMQYGKGSGLFVSRSELGGLRCEVKIFK